MEASPLQVSRYSPIWPVQEANIRVTGISYHTEYTTRTDIHGYLTGATKGHKIYTHIYVYTRTYAHIYIYTYTLPTFFRSCVASWWHRRFPVGSWRPGCWVPTPWSGSVPAPRWASSRDQRRGAEGERRSGRAEVPGDSMPPSRNPSPQGTRSLVHKSRRPPPALHPRCLSRYHRHFHHLLLLLHLLLLFLLQVPLRLNLFRVTCSLQRDFTRVSSFFLSLLTDTGWYRNSFPVQTRPINFGWTSFFLFLKRWI